MMVGNPLQPIAGCYLRASPQSVCSLWMRYGARALAGLRVGYAISDDGLIEALIRSRTALIPIRLAVRPRLVQYLGDEEHFQRNRSMVIEERDRMTRERSWLGFEVLPSKANFVFADHPAHGGGELAAALREQRVLVRHFDKPRIADYVRITVGASADAGPTTGSPDPQSGR